MHLMLFQQVFPSVAGEHAWLKRLNFVCGPESTAWRTRPGPLSSVLCVGSRAPPLPTSQVPSFREQSLISNYPLSQMQSTQSKKEAQRTVAGGCQLSVGSDVRPSQLCQ